MNYQIPWLPFALKLASAWLAADSAIRKAITLAAHKIEEELAFDPTKKGESREEDVRIHFVSPLAVTFMVDVEKRVVTVLAARLFSSRSK